MKKESIAVLIICIILVAISVPIGLYMGKFSEHWISETYFKNFTLAKDVVFDEPEIVEFYGGPIMFPAGTRGSVSESISGGIDVKGNEYINVHIMAESGTAVDAAISADPNAEKSIYTDIYGVVAVFAQNDIEDHETILAGYKAFHDRYYSRVKAAHTASIVASVAVSLVLSCVICLVNANRIKKAED